MLFITFICSVYGKVQKLKKMKSNNISKEKVKNSIKKTNSIGLCPNQVEREERIYQLRHQVSFLEDILFLKKNDINRYNSIVKEMYGEADKSRDGKVNFNEFVEYFAEALNKNSSVLNSHMYDIISGQDKFINIIEFEEFIKYLTEIIRRELAYYEYQQDNF